MIFSLKPPLLIIFYLMISITEWKTRTRKEKAQYRAQMANHREPRLATEEPVVRHGTEEPREPRRKTEEPREPRTELGFSKLNKKERRKFSLEILAEALDKLGETTRPPQSKTR